MSKQSKGSNRKALDKKLAAYGVAAGAALALAGPADAAVVYSGPQDYTNMGLNIDGTGYANDLSIIKFGNGATSFMRVRGPVMGSGASASNLAASAVISAGQNWLFGSSTNNNAFNLAIGSNTRFSTMTYYGGWSSARAYYPLGGPFLETKGYLGVRFDANRTVGAWTPDANTEWHYGWVELTVEHDSASGMSIKVTGWAYEDVAGAALLAGQTSGTYTPPGGGDPVPEPSSLALLAMGAAGLTAWRRKRDAA